MMLKTAMTFFNVILIFFFILPTSKIYWARAVAFHLKECDRFSVARVLLLLLLMKFAAVSKHENWFLIQSNDIILSADKYKYRVLALSSYFIFPLFSPNKNSRVQIAVRLVWFVMHSNDTITRLTVSATIAVCTPYCVVGALIKVWN